MKSNLLYLGLIGLSLAACHGKPAADMPETVIDTVNHTKSYDSTQMTTNTGQPAVVGDSAFLTTANDIGMFEIKIGQLAEKNSQNTHVKSLAAMMIQDHTAFGNQVTAMAQKKGITLPTALSDDMQKEYDKLNGLTGKAFDKEYADVNVKGHRQAILLFERTRTNQDCSSDVQSLASSALPTLRKHKEHSDMLKSQLKA